MAARAVATVSAQMVAARAVAKVSSIVDCKIISHHVRMFMHKNPYVHKRVTPQLAGS